MREVPRYQLEARNGKVTTLQGGLKANRKSWGLLKVYIHLIYIYIQKAYIYIYIYGFSVQGFDTTLLNLPCLSYP